MKTIGRLFIFLLSGVFKFEFDDQGRLITWSIRNRAYFMVMAVYVIENIFYFIQSGSPDQLKSIVSISPYLISGVVLMSLSAVLGQKFVGGDNSTISSILGQLPQQAIDLLKQQFNIDVNSYDFRSPNRPYTPPSMPGTVVTPPSFIPVNPVPPVMVTLPNSTVVSNPTPNSINPSDIPKG